ncbi:DUF6301 family protein [Nocardia camponoti]|uniref:Uncharacterized protein n=1 Tax=Nocardia camponoti TaxID=1616106 RepID=A0A917QA49_9NOCA|nr:hypothetical protein GCM10011591_07600 [Nocardia camponoti]
MSHLDLDGAAALVLAAARFDWKWRVYDLPKFCRAAGWELVDLWPEGATMQSNLNVEHRSALAYFEGTPRTLMHINLSIAERGQLKSPKILSGFVSELTSILEPELGAPTKARARPSKFASWELHGVILTVRSMHGIVNLTTGNPEDDLRSTL